MKNKEDTRAGSDIVAEVSDRIRNASNVLIALSKDPSIDELSAALGLSLILDKLNKRATAIFSGKIPNIIEFLQPEKTFEENTDSLQDFIVSLNAEKADHLRYKIEGDYVKVFFTPYRKETISEKDLQFSHGDFNVDLIISLNISEEAQLDDALREYGRIKHDASSVNIAASAPGKFGDIEWGDPSASSICEMVVRLALDIQDPDEPVIDENVATTLLTGIISATNRFSNERTSADTMSVASNLMISGANQQLIAKNIPVDILTKQPEPVKEEPKEEPKPEPVEEKKPEEPKEEPKPEPVTPPKDPTSFSIEHKAKAEKSGPVTDESKEETLKETEEKAPKEDFKPESKPEPKAEAKPEEPKEEPKPEPKSEPKTETAPVLPKPETKPEVESEAKPEPKAEAKPEVVPEKPAANDPKAETARIVAERVAKQEADKAAAEEKLRKEEEERKKREEEERAKNNAAKEEVMAKLIAEHNESAKNAGEGSVKHDLLQKEVLPPEPPKDYAKMISTELNNAGGPGYVPSSVDDTPTLTSEVNAPAAPSRAPVIKPELTQDGILPPPPAPVGPSFMPPALPTIDISSNAPAAPATSATPAPKPTAPIVETAPVVKPMVESAPVVNMPKPEPVMPAVQAPSTIPAQPKPVAAPTSFASSMPAAMPGQTAPATPAPAPAPMPAPTPVTPPASSNPQADPGAFHIPGM
jgi:ribonuclease E